MRRSDLYTRSSSSSPEPSSPIDPDTSARFREQLASLYGAVFPPSYTSESVPRPGTNDDSLLLPLREGEQDQDEEQEFDFRLFSNDKSGKIVLKEEVADEGVFIVKERNKSYYFTGPIDGKRKEEYAIAALSGEDVFKGRQQRYWGFEVPWRVRLLKVGFDGQKMVGDNRLGISNVSEGKKKKRKPNKRRRILLRERRRQHEAQEEAITREKEGKEEAEKEKRARKNREKKVKRKAKEKALKAATVGGAELIGSGIDEGNE